MRNRPILLRWPQLMVDFRVLFTCSAAIVVVTEAYLAAGLLALAGWSLTGNDAWVEYFFRVPAALLMAALAATELVFSLMAVREFSPGQPLRIAWQAIAISAACGLLGTLLVHVVPADFVGQALGPLGLSSGNVLVASRNVGFVVGSFQYPALAVGLFWSLRAYRRAGLLARLAAIDWVLLAGVAAFVIREARDLAIALRHGKHPNLTEILGWQVDPVLWLLLLEALFLFRSVQKMGPGRIGKCWKALTAGVLLVSLGDLSLWAANYGYMPYPWNALGWYVWLPAASAFALGPAYQLEAIYYAHSSQSPSTLASPI